MQWGKEREEKAPVFFYKRSGAMSKWLAGERRVVVQAEVAQCTNLPGGKHAPVRPEQTFLCHSHSSQITTGGVLEANNQETEKQKSDMWCLLFSVV